MRAGDTAISAAVDYADEILAHGVLASLAAISRRRYSYTVLMVYKVLDSQLGD